MGIHHLGVRIAAALGQLPADALTPQPGWPALYRDLDDMLAAKTLPPVIDADVDGLEADPADQPLSVADTTTGKTRLLSRKCGTCIFKPGDRMHLGGDRLRQFLTQVRSRESFVICHNTLPYHRFPDALPAVCRGSFDALDTHALRLMRGWGFLEVDPPGEAVSCAADEVVDPR